MKPHVTVLTTIYNGLPYLPEAMESILNQSYTDFEFLIIDDASTDKSLDCINSYQDPRIRVFQNKKNIGQVPSLNKGLKLAKGKYIARFDQDDVSLPNRIEEQIDFMEKNPDVSIVSSWEHTIDSSGQKLRSWKRALHNYGDFLGCILVCLCPVWHPSVMVRKEVLLKMDGFDTSFAPAEDFELWTRIALRRLNAAVVPNFHLLQRQHNQRQSVLKKDKQQDFMHKAHFAAVSSFTSHRDANCLAALLRLEKDPCGRRYGKDHTKEILCALKEMISNVKEKQNLTDYEMESLESKIYKRLGLGVRYGGTLTRFPSLLFYATFFGLSPLLIPNVRIVLSKTYNKIHEFKNLVAGKN